MGGDRVQARRQRGVGKPLARCGRSTVWQKHRRRGWVRGQHRLGVQPLSRHDLADRKSLARALDSWGQDSCEWEPAVFGQQSRPPIDGTGHRGREDPTVGDRLVTGGSQVP